MNNKIAVIGMSGLFPGSDNLESFWDNLLEKRDCRTEASAKQMGRDPKAFLGKQGEDDRFYCLQGGYIDGFEMDASSLALSDLELKNLDDVYQWSLYVARESLRDSGYLDKPKPQETGVILGNLSFPTKSSNQLFIPVYNKAVNTALSKKLEDKDFILPRFAENAAVSKESGLLAGYPSSLLAQALNLKGSNFCLDAACASSVYAVKLASEYLLSGRADMMLAGAVSAADPFFVNLGFSVFQAYPNNNISAPLDTRSQGLFAGEGAGMLVLKRYEDALRDGDNIRAVILGGGLSNDGKGQHVLSPNSKGQMLALERAYESAGINPSTVDYLECHATGTPLGDKVELTSLENFFAPHLEGKNAPLIGSVKSNLGHLLTAAGMPGMMKAILAMEKNLIPASINIEEKQSSPMGSFADKQICSENTEWRGENGISGEGPKRAGVSVFGFGGANAHMVFESVNDGGTLSDADRKLEIKKIESNKKPEKRAAKPLSIIGMDAHFGACENLAQFEKVIIDGDQLFTELPEKRWKGLEDEELVRSALGGKIPLGAYIESFPLDFLGFRLPPNMDDRLIPQQLLLMKVADQALKDAKVEKGGKVAVLVAMGTELELHQIRTRVNFDAQFDELWQNESLAKQYPEETREQIENVAKDGIHQRARLNQYTSAIGNIMASRISSLWDFNGPAFTVSAEENSVFQALELAQIMLSSGECDALVLGAVDLSASAESLLLRKQFGQMNIDAGHFSLSDKSQGWSVGEGAGAIVLKLKDQVSEERVYANIDALAFDGDLDQGLTNACHKTLAQCDYELAQMEYWELSASGFADLDLNEQKSIFSLSEKADFDHSHMALGSVKGNLGHTFAASGIASLIKTALCLHDRVIPSVPNWQSPKNNQFDWRSSGFYVPTTSKTWFKNGEDNIRKAGVNGLALDGRAYFVAMSEGEEAQKRETQYLYESDYQLITVKGKNSADILSKLDLLEKEVSEIDWARQSLAQFASQIFHRDSLENSDSGCSEVKVLSILAKNKETLSKEINLARDGVKRVSNTLKNWHSPSGSYYTENPGGIDQDGEQAKVAFVYPGAFNSYLNIAKDLNHLFPENLSYLSEHTNDIGTLLGDRLHYPRSTHALSAEEERALQKALPDDAIDAFENGISISVVYTDIVSRIFGIKPDAAFGYSMGEVSMMYALGVWGKTDSMSAKLRSTEVFQTRLAGPMNTLREAWNLSPEEADGSFWSGFALLAPVDEIKKAVAGETYVRLILINTENEAVIAGKPEDCKRVAESLNCEYFEAALGDVIHCDWVRNDFDALSDLHVMDVNPRDDIDFYTAVGNKKLKIEADVVSNNIAEMYCNPVDFKTLVETVYDDGHKVFIELGARDNSGRHINQILQEKSHVTVSLNRKGANDKLSLLKALAKLNSHQVAVDLSRLYKETSSGKVKKQLWIDVELGGNSLIKTIEDAKFSTSSPSPFEGLKHNEAKIDAGNVKNDALKRVVKSSDLNPDISRLKEPKINNVVGMENQTNKVHAIKSMNKNIKAISEKNVSLTTEKLSATTSEFPSNLQASFQKNMDHLSAAHEVFLDARKDAMIQAAELISLQAKAAYGIKSELSPEAQRRTVTSVPKLIQPELRAVSTQSDFDQSLVKYPNADLSNVIWDEEDLREFAEGDIAKVFGESYGVIDSYHRRVRLPTTEYLLVSRVTKLDATCGEYKPCSMTTEYDVPYDYWYSAKGQIPWAVAVESGQCDLLLISYLGIDFQNKGDRVYRLLDCELTFMDDVAMEGDTLRYDISINSYAQSGDGFLFFFSYNCYVGDHLVLKMRNGAAGFFTDSELDAGKGVIETEGEKAARLKIVKQSFNSYLSCDKRKFDNQDMQALCDGDLASCFNSDYAQGNRNQNLVFSAPKMLMIERIIDVDPTGGAYGLGLLVGEKTLDPDHWYFPCHFKQDQVMAGSLMSDGCSQLLRFYTWFLGLHTLTEDAVFQPIPGLGQQVRCRGQVLPQHGTLVYKMEITEIGTDPYPYAKANVDIILNGKIVVDFKNLGLFLGEIKGSEIEKKLARRERVLSGQYDNLLRNSTDIENDKSKNGAFSETESQIGVGKVKHEGHVYVPGLYEVREHPFEPFAGNKLDANAVPDTLPFTQFHFIEFATGRIANCFGEEFGGIYDGRTPPRTPNADLQLTTRVIDIDGERNQLKRVSSTVAEFDCPADAWFFEQSTHPDLMPYSIIMEISLQPNGFISAWVGTTLMFPERDLYFRNLDGSGTLLAHVDLRGKTIRNESTLLSTTAAGNTIIQSFKYNLSVDGVIFYEGTSVFGYFVKDALTHQLGMDKGKVLDAWHLENKVPEQDLKEIDLLNEESSKKLYLGESAKPFYHLAGPQLNLLDRIVLSKTAGKNSMGYIYAEKTIDKNDWFFPCHFHQDPVMPGSLGVEAILQAMQIWILDNDLGEQFNSPRFKHDLSTVKWKYRGQIIPDNKVMSLDVHISNVEIGNEKIIVCADASLYKDGLRIYELFDAKICLVES